MTGSCQSEFHAGRASQVLLTLLTAPVLVYRRFVSPMLPPACRFHPTCSAYALEALRIHGPLKGLWFTLRRLARCHPFTLLGGGSGCDPVPPRTK